MLLSASGQAGGRAGGRAGNAWYSSYVPPSTSEQTSTQFSAELYISERRAPAPYPVDDRRIERSGTSRPVDVSKMRRYRSLQPRRTVSTAPHWRGGTDKTNSLGTRQCCTPMRGTREGAGGVLLDVEELVLLRGVQRPLALELEHDHPNAKKQTSKQTSKPICDKAPRRAAAPGGGECPTYALPTAASPQQRLATVHGRGTDGWMGPQL